MRMRSTHDATRFPISTMFLVLGCGVSSLVGCLGSDDRDAAVSTQARALTVAAATDAWRPFNAQSPWNTPIADNPELDPSSASFITDFSTIAGQDRFWVNIQDYSVPVYYVSTSVTPMVTVAAELGATGFRAGAANDGTDAGHGPAPIPVGALPALGIDRHLAIVDRAAGTEWGFWNARLAASGWVAGLAATMDLGGSGVRPPEHEAPWWAGHGPRACGFSLIAGLITVEEMRAGHIEHALVMAYPHIRSRYYTPPASTAQAQTDEAIPTRGIMCGGRIQLDPGLDVTALGLSAPGVIIARALQKYGAYVGDFSGSVTLYAESSKAAQRLWRGLLDNEVAGNIPLNRFRVLKLGTQYDNMN